MPERRPRPRPLPPDVVGSVTDIVRGTPDAEVLERLEQALAALPPTERHAVVTALGYAEGSDAVARELGLSDSDAASLVQSGLQLLRGALGDVVVDDREVFGRLAPRQGVAKRHRPNA